MNKFFLIALVVFFSIAACFVYLGFAQGEKAKTIKSIKIGAVEPAAKLLKALDADWKIDYKEKKKVRGFDVGIKTSDEAKAIKDFADAKVDAIAITRVFKKNEIVSYTNRTHRAPVVIPVFKMPIVAVVHKANAIKQLSIDKLRKIFTGEIKSWRELDKTSVDDKIEVILPPAESAVYREFKKRILKNSDFVKGAIAVNEAKIAENVKIRTAAIAFLSRCYVPENEPVREVMLTDAKGKKYVLTDADIRKEVYPLVMTIYFYVSEVKPEALKLFLDFAKKNPRGIRVYRDNKFVSVKLNE